MTLPPASLHDENAYLAELLRSYLALHDTPSRARPADRRLARSLFQQAVPLDIVRAALLLAAARRTFRQPGATPLAPVRSLYYFLPIIQELCHEPLDPAHLAYLSAKLASSSPSR